MSPVAATATPPTAFPAPATRSSCRRSSPSDRQAQLAGLVERIANADSDALADLYDRTCRLVFGVALRLLWQHEEAEEVALDVYTQVWKNAGAYAPSRGTVEAWLVTLARTRAIDRLRARSVRPDCQAVPLATLTEPAATAPGADDMLEAATLGARLRDALTHLSTTERTLVELAFFSGYTHTELSERLGLPLGTVKTRIRNALIKLKSLVAARPGTATLTARVVPWPTSAGMRSPGSGKATDRRRARR